MTDLREIEDRPRPIRGDDHAVRRLCGVAIILVPLVWIGRVALVAGDFLARLIGVVAIAASVVFLAAAVAGMRVGAATDLLAGAGVLAYMATMYTLSLRALQRLAARARVRATL